MKKKPNVVIIMSDQLRAFEIGSYGHPVIRTPNINRLSKEGVQFDIAVTNNPVCTPARSSLLSGQYSRTCCGKLGNETDEAPPRERKRLCDSTLPEELKKAGYNTYLIGKWHIGAHPELIGFDEYVFPKMHHLNKNQIYFEPSGRAFTVPGYAADYNLEQLRSFLSRQKKDDNPFFLFYNIYQPHMPFFDVPQRYKTMYSPEDVYLRENVWVNGKIARDEHWFKIYFWDYLYYNGLIEDRELSPDKFDLKSLTALYYGMVTYADDQVGEIVRELERNDLLENTIVIFTSDHGDNLGSHHLFNKDVLFEESIRIPMIYYYPGFLQPYINKTQVTQIIDVVPTVLDMCGLKIPEHIQGKSLLPILTQQKEKLENNFAFIETSQYQIGIRTPSHLYGMKIDRNTKEITDEEVYFFDLKDDPFQKKNMAKTDKQREVAKRLNSKLKDWHKGTQWFKK